MNNHQLGKLLVLSCIGSNVLAGLLPESDTEGYQYNRPGGGFESGGYASNANFGGGHSGNFGASSYRGRINQGYGSPNSIDDTFDKPGGFGGQSSSYRQFGSDGGYQDSNVGGYQAGYSGRDDERPQPYSFHYEVIDPPSSNDYSQRESSDGNIVQGEYRVLLPDSRTQIVRYTADDVNGYNADVQYEGQAQYPRGDYGPGGYQESSFSGNYQGRGGSGFNEGASNQYLPPHNDYRK